MYVVIKDTNFILRTIKGHNPWALFNFNYKFNFYNHFRTIIVKVIVSAPAVVYNML